MPQRSVLLVALLFILIHTGSGQGLIISSGTNLMASGVNMVHKGKIINNGSYINSNNTTIFSGSVQVVSGTTPVVFNNLTIGSGSTTSLTTIGQSINGILLCNGTLNANGNLILLASASETALIDGSGTGQVNGNVTIQQYLSSGFGYKYLSSPFQAATVDEFSENIKLTDPFPTFYRYDESNTTSGWVSYVDPLGILNPMQGYAGNFGSSDPPLIFDATGVVNNGSLSSTLYNHNNTYTQGFNLVGNPYPSPIDWDAPSGWTKINIDNALYYFEASSTDEFGGSYVTYSNGVSSNGLATNLIPTMQGFFVHVSNGTWPVEGTLGMNNNVRVTNLNHHLIKSENSVRPLIRLTAEFSDDTVSVDPVVIYFDEKATDLFDGQLDALKLMNTDFMVPNLYAVGSDGARFSISALPIISDTLLRVPLGLNLNRDGNIIFKISALEGNLTDMEIYFSDIVTGIKQSLLHDEQYEVNLDYGQYENRFFLDFRNIWTGIPEYPSKDDLFKIYCSHGILKLEINTLPGADGTLMITNLTGQILLVENYYEPGYYELNPGLINGIYIVSFFSGNKRSSQKIFIQNR
ncbi:MAG: hypothetical protein WAW07_04990 [Bacteroidales bacterium]